MTAQSYIKFYPSDWLGDVKLRQCSIAARGLWLDLICIMHEATPYGHLAFNDKPMSYYRIAQLVHADRKQVQRLIAHLKTRGVLRVTSRGILYSKRMVNDKLKSEQARELSKWQWGPRPYAPVPYKKERGPTEGSKGSIIDPNPRRVGRIKAQHRIERDLLQQLGEEGYARAIEALAANPKLVDRATEAERRSPGSGVMAAMLGLRQKA